MRDTILQTGLSVIDVCVDIWDRAYIRTYIETA